MVRKLAAAMLGVGVFIPGLANALGLGEIKLNSALSEPLDAEIELVQVRELTSTEILPTLANENDFANSHIERYHFLTDLKFKVVVNEKGKSVIRISSSKPVKEPFLNFLVEVNWPAGRLLREYTLLLDPPVYSSQKAAPVTQPTRAATATKSVPSYEAADQQQTYSSGTYAQNSSGGSPQVETHTIGSNDSLWAIATDMKPSDKVNIQQTMMAIQRINPDAFIDNNINLLKKGQVLRAPTEEEAMSLTSREAIAMAGEQNRLWREKLANRGITTEADTRQVDLSGRSVTREQEPAPSDESARLKLVSGADGGAGSGQSGSGTAENGNLRNDLAVAEENIDKFKLEKEELQLRVNDLEDQLDTSEKVLTLKDEQIAALQAKLRELEQQQAAEAAEADADTGVETPPMVVDDAMEPVPEEIIEEEVVTEEEVDYNYQDEVVADADTSEEEQDSATAEPEVEPESEEISAVGVIMEEPAEQQPQPIPEPVAENPGILQQLMQNPLYLAAGGGAIVLLILLGLIALRKKQGDDELEEDMVEDFQLPDSQDDAMLQLDSVDLDSDDDFEEAVEASADEETVAQTSDVIGEADIYIAYGRFPQAIEMLENAAVKEPNRSDIRLKLCEVCAEANEPDTFMTHYAAIQSLGDASDLAKANELKAKINLDDAAPIAEETDSFESFDSDLSGSDFEASDFETSDFETSEFDRPVSDVQDDDDTVILSAPDLAESSAPDAPDSFDFDISESDAPNDVTAESETDLDFDLDELRDADSALDSDAASTTTDEVAGLDFDLNLELEDEANSASELPVADATDDTTMDFDTDFSLDDVPDSGSSEETPPLDSSLEFDGSGSLDEVPDATAPETPLAGDDSAMDFDLDFDSSESAPEVPTVEPDSLLDSFEAPADADDDEPLIDSQSAAQLADELDLDLDGDFLSTSSTDSVVTESDDFGADDFVDELPASSDTSGLELPPAANDIADSGDDLDFLSDEDEASTKLDLARAYIDMGDREGAKDILDEVMIEGNDSQKQEAKDLLIRLES